MLKPSANEVADLIQKALEAAGHNTSLWLDVAGGPVVYVQDEDGETLFTVQTQGEA